MEESHREIFCKTYPKTQDKLAEIKLKDGLNEQLELQDCIKLLTQQARLQRLTFVYGAGKHKVQLQKDIGYLTEIAKKQGEYGKYLSLMGEDRNSLSKTDPDATFMH